MSGAERLYTPELLALTLRLAYYPWTDDLPLTGDARSKSCGSTLSIALEVDAEGRIGKIAIRARACAVGQASAAIFADAATGLDRAKILAARNALAAWLAGNGPIPDWPNITMLEAAHSYPGRHGAIMLAWEAALAALSTGQPSS